MSFQLKGGYNKEKNSFELPFSKKMAHLYIVDTPILVFGYIILKLYRLVKIIFRKLF